MMSLLSNFVNYVTSPLYTLVSSPTWFFSAPGKIFGLSVPWRVGAFTGLSLTVIVSVVGLLQVYYPDLFGQEVMFVANDKPQYWALIAILVLAFSIVTGLATHFWLMDVPSRYPLIDNAWKRGVAELQVAGIELTEIPLFLICGIPDTAGATSLMQGSGLTLVIKPPENESQPLLWFTAEKDGDLAIFLFLCTCCQTSLMSAGRGLEKEKAVKGGRSDNAGARGTIEEAVQSEEYGGFHSIASSSEGRRPQASVMDLDTGSDFGGGKTEPIAAGRQQAARNTIDDDSESPSTIVSAPRIAAGVSRLSASSAKAAEEELQYVCRKLRIARQPFCPCNGVVSSVPFELLKSGGDGQGKNLGQATRTDLKHLTSELGLRTHAIAVVHGLDGDDDFRTFVKRMREFQSAADVDRRLGKGLNPWAEGSEGSVDLIEQVAHCSCDAFQRLIYKFFSSTQSLKKVDNGQLYRFLANIRGRVEVNLTGWLVEGFATHEDKDGQPTDAEGLPQFAGCYFVAAQPQTSDVEDEERLFAHVPGVFERLYELEGEIEWTRAASDRDTAYRFAANVFFLLTLAGILAIVVGLYGFLGKNSSS